MHFTRMYSYVGRMYSHVTRMYSYVALCAFMLLTISMLKAWRTETREKKLSEMCNCSKNFWEWKKNEEREVHTIAPAELNKYLAEFIRSVRRKDVSSPALKGIWRKMTTPWVSSGTNNLNWRGKVFTQNEESWKKSARGNKTNAAVTLTDEEINLLFENNLLGVSSAESLCSAERHHSF